MPGKAPKKKGDRFELSTVHLLNDMGVPAQRIPLSGAAGGDFAGDVKVIVQGEPWTVECKCRAYGFKMIYAWLGKNQALFFKEDRCESLVVIRLSDFARLAGMSPIKQEAAE